MLSTAYDKAPKPKQAPLRFTPLLRFSSPFSSSASASSSPSTSSSSSTTSSPSTSSLPKRDGRSVDPSRSFPCDTCEKVFWRQTDLTRHHINTTTGPCKRPELRRSAADIVAYQAIYQPIYRQDHKKEIAEYKAQCYQDHKEEILLRLRQRKAAARANEPVWWKRPLQASPPPREPASDCRAVLPFTDSTLALFVALQQDVDDFLHSHELDAAFRTKSTISGVLSDGLQLVTRLRPIGFRTLRDGDSIGIQHVLCNRVLPWFGRDHLGEWAQTFCNLMKAIGQVQGWGEHAVTDLSLFIHPRRHVLLRHTSPPPHRHHRRLHPHPPPRLPCSCARAVRPECPIRLPARLPAGGARLHHQRALVGVRRTHECPESGVITAVRDDRRRPKRLSKPMPAGRIEAEALFGKDAEVDTEEGMMEQEVQEE